MSGENLPATVAPKGLYGSYKTNREKEWNGVPYTVANPDPAQPAATFYLARIGKMNKEYAKELERRTRPYRRQIQLGTMADSLAEQIYMEVFVSTVLKGWEHVTDETGSEMAFNAANATKLLTDLPDLYDELQAAANDAARYRDEMLEGEAGN